MRVPLWARLVLAALVAGVAIVALEWYMRRREGEVLAFARVGVSAAAAATLAGDAPIRDLGFWAARVVLVANEGDEPAPVVLQLLADGSHLVRRPPPLPSVPGRPRWPVVSIVLPNNNLAALDPTQRAGLLELLAALLPKRPVPGTAVRARGVHAKAADFAALLRWIR